MLLLWLAAIKSSALLNLKRKAKHAQIDLILSNEKCSWQTQYSRAETQTLSLTSWKIS